MLSPAIMENVFPINNTPSVDLTEKATFYSRHVKHGTETSFIQILNWQLFQIKLTTLKHSGF